MEKEEKPFVLVIHGGSGAILKKNMTQEKEIAYRNKLSEAIKAGYQVLNNQGKSSDAIEAAILVMEDSPLFNAGKGAVFTHYQTNQLDASFMDGSNLKAGAIAGVTKIKNPIKTAKKVAYQSQHVMLVKEGAQKFAEEKGQEIVDPSYFFDQNRYNQLQQLKLEDKIGLDHDAKENEKQMKGGKIKLKSKSSQIEFNVDLNAEKKFGTVGAVALDVYGNIAAGTSTGGMMNKKYGRVGDSPIIGCGTYANNKTCAVSCTGHGEFFMRNVVAYDVSAMMEYKGVTLDEATKEIIHQKLEKQDARGGLIAVDQQANISMQFNTEGMYRGYVRNNGQIYIGIYQEPEIQIAKN